MMKRKQKNKSLKGLKLLASVAVIIFLVSIIMLLLYSQNDQPDKVQIMPYDFIVKEGRGLGMNADTDLLHFGGGHRGTTLSRELLLTSHFDARVVITKEGPGDVRAAQNNFNITANETKTVRMALFLDDSLSPGNYSGELIVEFYALE